MFGWFCCFQFAAVGVALAGTFTDDSFQASDYSGNACALFESEAWQLQVKAGGSTTVAAWCSRIRR